MPKKDNRNWAQKIWNEVLGSLILILGIILILPGVPGPGLILIIIGLTLLSKDFKWAHALLEKAKETKKSAVKKASRK